MKKIVKILAIILVLLIIAIISIPFVFQGKIIDLVKETANNNINAKLDFTDADLTVWSSYPNAEVSLTNVSIINQAPFEGDTLFAAKTIDLKLPIWQLFKKNEDISITSFVLDGALISIKVDKEGNANYDIAKENKDKSKSDPLQLNLDDYKITNSTITYLDESSNLLLKLSDLNHSGEGNFSSETSQLKTNSTALASFQMDSVDYLNKHSIVLDAVIGMDFKENKYSFLENKALINQLPLVFDGFIKLNENNKQVKINFKTPSSDFKNFLALIPKQYSKNIEGVKTTGNFDVKGTINGVIDDVYIPKFNVAINSKNASFKYPDLPKSLESIHINTQITNTTGLVKDTYVLIDTLSFRIDKDRFNAKVKLLDITENMKVTAHVDGNLNLANLEKVYPAEAVKNLKGLLNINANTSFDMLSIEKEKYENTRTSGVFKLSNFQYVSDELSHPLQINKAGLTLNPKTVKLTNFDAQLGKTDFKATGAIDNLLGFLFNDENIEGKFNIVSNTFAVNDFMTAEIEQKNDSTTVKTGQESIKVPSFLDCTINAKANTVLYDDITLKNVSGTLFIKDEKATLKNMKSNVFNGALGFNGSVSTKEKTPKFTMDLDAKNFNIGQSFKVLDLFKALAPIANAIEGKINTKISLSGNLNSDFTPDLNSITGDLLAQLMGSKIAVEQSHLLQKLESNLKFLDPKKLKLKNLKSALSFKDGKVVVKPFSLNYDDIKIDISGGHGFDNTLGYKAIVNVPVKYLGKEVIQLIEKIDKTQTNLKIPVNALISGSLKSPSIKTDLKAAVTDLTKQLIAKQKDKLIEEGKDKIKEEVQDKVEDALKGIIGGGTKEKDTTATDTTTVKTKKTTEEVEDLAKDVLNGLFGKKKKKKDTMN